MPEIMGKKTISYCILFPSITVIMQMLEELLYNNLELYPESDHLQFSISTKSPNWKQWIRCIGYSPYLCKFKNPSANSLFSHQAPRLLCKDPPDVCQWINQE